MVPPDDANVLEPSSFVPHLHEVMVIPATAARMMNSFLLVFILSVI
jgi:hypothetical protein